MQSLPLKLNRDAIVEALCEVKFECFESAQLPELVVARLVDREHLRSYVQTRLGLADFPAAMRSQDPQLRFQPLIEVRSPDGTRILKIGPNVLSFHALAPYPGWDELKVEIFDEINHVFSQFREFRVVRLGIRYVNLLTDNEHGISDISQLNYSFTVADKPMDLPQVLSYERKYSSGHVALVRMASPPFVQGPLSINFSALVDVDVFTPPGKEFTNSSEAKEWLMVAHEIEKIEFFTLLRPETIEQLRAGE